MKPAFLVCLWVLAALCSVEAVIARQQATTIRTLRQQNSQQRDRLDQQRDRLDWFTTANQKASYLHCQLYWALRDHALRVRSASIICTGKLSKVYFIYQDGTRGYWQETP